MTSTLAGVLKAFTSHLGTKNQLNYVPYCTRRNANGSPPYCSLVKFATLEKNRRGRQLARVSAPQYHENLVSLIYPGNQTSQACLGPTVAAAERVLGLTSAQRQRTVLRLDGGFGTDANLNWSLWHGYQVLSKGYSGKRAKAFAQAVPQWEELRAGERWIAPAPHRSAIIGAPRPR